MTIGLSTYSFFWQHSDRVQTPLDLDAMLDRTAELDVNLFQICDSPEVERRSAVQLAALRARADTLGISLELGTRGVDIANLDRYLELASALGVRLVRTMLYTVGHRPSLSEAERLLRAALQRYEAAGVTLALETYEQVPTTTLVALVEKIGHPNLGICLDPANSVAALENPRDVIDLAADHVVNLHVKDFQFTRADGWVGFLLAGARLGEGSLDLDHLLDRITPTERGINQIIEHWLPWQGDAAVTIELENTWTTHNLNYLRSRES